jgi:hypothetical protein
MPPFPNSRYSLLCLPIVTKYEAIKVLRQGGFLVVRLWLESGMVTGKRLFHAIQQ